jgi:hypothetical protein
MYLSTNTLECPLCYDCFNLGNKTPRQLGCGHSVCELCLSDLVSMSKVLACPLCKHVLVNASTIVDPQLINFPKNYALINIIQTRETNGEPCRRHPDHLFEFYTKEGEKVCLKCVFDRNMVKSELQPMTEVAQRIEEFWNTHREGLKLLSIQYNEVNEEFLYRNFQKNSSSVLSRIRSEIDNLKTRLDQIYEEIDSFLNCHFKIAIYDQRLKSSCGQAMFDNTDKLFRLFKKHELGEPVDPEFLVRDLGLFDPQVKFSFDSFEGVLQELLNESVKLENINSRFKTVLDIPDHKTLGMIISNCGNELKLMQSKRGWSSSSRSVDICDSNVRLITDIGKIINFKEHLLQNLYNSGRPLNSPSELLRGYVFEPSV